MIWFDLFCHGNCSSWNAELNGAVMCINTETVHKVRSNRGMHVNELLAAIHAIVYCTWFARAARRRACMPRMDRRRYDGWGKHKRKSLRVHTVYIRITNSLASGLVDHEDIPLRKIRIEERIDTNEEQREMHPYTVCMHQPKQQDKAINSRSSARNHYGMANK